MEVHGNQEIQNLVTLIMVGQEIREMDKSWQPQTPLLTVDCVLFKDTSVILIKRGFNPFIGWYALPGGFVDVGETTEDACIREVKEEIGINIDKTKLSLVGVYSDPQRDPRHHTVSVVYVTCYNDESLKHGSDAASVELIKNWQSVKLAFDHYNILQDAWGVHKSINSNSS